MYPKQAILALTSLVLVAALALSGCSALIRPVVRNATAPTPVVVIETGGVENPDVYVDPAEFTGALLAAIAAGDREKLVAWMTEPFLTGTWRADLSDTPPADALQELYGSELGAGGSLAPVQGVDLPALLGGTDPLSIPRAGAGVVAAVLVGGWGQAGLDEAVLFITRRPDNSLAWHGWMRINGGISGARAGGATAYRNEALGFSVYLPAGYAVHQPSDRDISITAPQVEGAGHPGLASIQIEPANGRKAEDLAQQTYAEGKELMGDEANIYITAMGIGDTTAYVVFGLPGQDMHRQLFMVHNDRLYHLWFYPDEPVHSPVSYAQMENLYALITNTFAFTE